MSSFNIETLEIDGPKEALPEPSEEEKKCVDTIIMERSKTSPAATEEKKGQEN